MPLPTGYEALQDRVEAAGAKLWARLQTKQAEYLAGKGRYWQGKRNPTLVPVDAAPTDMDLALKPTDQSESWAALDFGVDLPVKPEFAMAVDVYDGPAGKGYTLVVWVKLAGKVFRRTLNYGPETYRAHGWKKLR